MRCLLLFSFLIPLCYCDLFTAIADMQHMLGAEKEVSTIIDQYIRAEEDRLEQLKEFAAGYVARNNDVASIGPEYITNPVNAYLLIKRLTTEWRMVEEMMKTNRAEYFIHNITENRIRRSIRFPGEEDLSGAAVALLRLQDVYKLDAHELSNGMINGEQIGQGLSAHDTFEIGRTAYNNHDHYHCITWMQAAFSKLEHENPKTLHEAEIFEYLASSLYEQGNLKRALALTKTLAKMEPNHPRAKDNVKFYQSLLAENKDTTKDLPPFVNERHENDGIPERDSYEALCRGEVPPPNPAEEKKLHCYLKRDTSFLLIAPIKVEILRLNPLAVLFKEVLSDDEIEVIKSLSTPKLQRATIQHPETGESETATYRISKSAWLKDEDSPVVARVNRRVEDMTNLDQSTSEELQIANYGLGGHYDPHYDFAMPEEKNAFAGLNTGNRIATVLFYMSQPEKGGATVFNTLDTAVFPTKHDALFWYNLKRSGEGDMRTRHAACPVLLGVKWVSNKWIHEYGQEFRRPCGLDEHVQENFIGDLTPWSA